MKRKFMRNKNMIYTFKFQIFVRLKGGSLKKEEGWAEFLKKSSKNIVYFEEVQYLYPTDV